MIQPHYSTFQIYIAKKVCRNSFSIKQLTKCEYIYIYIYITSNFNSFGIEILSWSSNQALNIMQGEIMARALTTILYHFIMVVYGKKII
jgi:hypothetical protein